MASIVFELANHDSFYFCTFTTSKLVMNIAIYSAFFSPETLTYIKTVIEYLETHHHTIVLVDRLEKHLGEDQERYSYFDDNEILKSNIDFLLEGMVPF